MTFIFGLTNPTMVIYFASRVSPEVLAIASMSSTGLAALINSSVKSDKVLELYKKYFSYIVTFDVLATYVVYACSIDYVAIQLHRHGVDKCIFYDHMVSYTKERSKPTP